MSLLLLVKIDSVWHGLPYFKDIEKIDDPLLYPIVGWSLLLAIIAVLATVAIVFIIDKRHNWVERIVNRSLTIAFILVWLIGFIVYDIGMYTGEPWSLFGNAPMAIFHAFGIFVLDSDVSAIHEPFHNSAWFMMFFSLVHFLAALVSLVFVLKHFGFNIIAAFRRRFARSPKENTYIFWGMNDATYYLAKDINNTKQARGDLNYRIVVVRTNNDTDNAVAKNGMERLFNFLSLKNKDLDRLKELDCITTDTYSNLATIETTTNEKFKPTNILREELRLKSICRFIRKTNGTVHLFFLSDNEEANILGVENLRRDNEILTFTKKGKVVFYCHARYNSAHRVIEDEHFSENVEVKVVDSSHISVELLKRNVELQPVSFVKIENDATVSSSFNSLVVGFSEVGMDAVRFLYEFGAFVKTGSTNENVVRSGFSCHVIDKEMSNLAGVFVANAPSIKPAMPFLEKDTDSDTKSSITLHQMDYRSVTFYQELKGWIGNNLNYIVICTENDELNISLAIRIFRLSIRYRQTMENLCILVRIHNDKNGHIQRIAEHYNRLWAAELHSNDKEKRTHQKTITNNEHLQMPIYLFGSDKETYTYENIISENLEREAKLYKDKYDASINAMKRQSGNREEETQNWENEHKDLMQLTDEYKGYSPTYSGVMRLRRIQSQNRENSLHLHTKQRLAYRALGDNDYSILTNHQLFRKENEITYTWKDYIKPRPSVTRVLDVLAQTEHLRWNASHEILGYQDKGNEKYKDEARLYHGCIKEWNALSDITKSFDYNVVDVSLDIIENDRNA